MKADYKNWMPLEMAAGFGIGTASFLAAELALKSRRSDSPSFADRVLRTVFGTGALVCGAFTVYSVAVRMAFSYDGKRKLSKQIVEGVADYVTIPDGGTALDVGCGSGALTIACAKRNPNATVIGVDRWGMEYRGFSQELCERNAAAEGVTNVRFQRGDARKLDFPDETFDAVVSNYVYHNITGADKQELLRETLRVLKKGGAFAIHDLMSKARYRDMRKFMRELYDAGYEKVELIDTTRGMFMTPAEEAYLLLFGSTLLVGRK